MTYVGPLIPLFTDKEYFEDLIKNRIYSFKEQRPHKCIILPHKIKTDNL